MNDTHFQKVRFVAEMVALIAIIISLIFFTYELRLSRSIALNESFANTAEASIAINSFLAEHASIWYAGCTGEELTIEEKAVFVKLVTAADRLNFARYQRAIQGVSTARSRFFTLAIASDMQRFPGFRDTWREVAKIMNSLSPGESWFAEVESVYSDLTGSSDNTNVDATLCGIY